MENLVTNQAFIKTLELTPKEEELRRLRFDEGKGLREIARILGISYGVVSKRSQIVNVKVGRAGHAHAAAEQSIEHKDPEKASKILGALAEPKGTYDDIKEAYERNGLSAPASAAIVRRLKVKYADGITAERDYKTHELEKFVTGKLGLTLSYMDDKTAAEASHRDLGLVAAALIEKRQLLRGEPTQIMSDERRKKLNELIPLLVEEAKRRGITIEGEIVTKTVTPE